MYPFLGFVHREMPLLGSKRRKPDADATAATTTRKANDVLEKTLNIDTQRSADGSRPASLRAKASSPQLLPRKSDDNSSQRRPGLNRNFSRSWYGSWNSKASAVAQVVAENVSVAGGLTKESSSPPVKEETDSIRSGTIRRTSKNTISSPGSALDMTKSKEAATDAAAGKQTEGAISAVRIDSPSIGDDDSTRSIPAQADPRKGSAISTEPKHNPAVQTWLGWWSRPDGYASSETDQGKEQQSNETGQLQDVPPKSTADDAKGMLAAEMNSGPLQKDTSSVSKDDTIQPRSWFGLWSASQNQPAEGKDTSEPPRSQELTTDLASKSEGTSKDNMPITVQPPKAASATDAATARTSTDSETRPKSAGWAFWSKDQAAPSSQDESKPQKHLGEIAVANTPSQSHPEAAQYNEMPSPSKEQSSAPQLSTSPRDVADGGVVSKPAKADKTTVDSKGNKAVKKIVESDKAFASSAKSMSSASLSLPEVPKPDIIKKIEAGLTPAAKALKAQQPRPNMVEPQFHKTYPKAHVPSYWENLGYYLGYPFGLAPPNHLGDNHVSIAPVKPKIKNAIAIGVHGYFPNPIVSRIIGQPTGTSIRFATHAAAAIRAWVQANQPDTACEVEQVALEGEGFIADRVATLWKLLLNWLAQLRNADFILVAAHSQGVPVAVMLVAKLIQLGCLNAHAKIGICAMAGVNLGPFADYRSRFFGGSALELFDFCRPDSKVSREYASAIDVVLRHGVKVTYVGSIDDQLVSLEVCMQR